MRSSIPLQYEYFPKTSIWPIDWTQKGITILGLYEPGSYGDEGVITNLQDTSELQE